MVPFSVPHKAKNQERYVLDALGATHVHGDGAYSRKAAAALRALSGAGEVLLVPSASHALELIFWDLPPRAEVILPAYTFPSAANAVLRGGGRVVLCDVEPASLSMDPHAAAAKITADTYALCVTHYAGIACDMDAFESLARERGTLLVEDAAECLGAAHTGRPLGGIGHFGCYSFHGTKNITCGEGGAYIQRATADAAFDAALCHREKGTNRHKFLRGEAPFYSWEMTGSSLLLAEPLCAMLLAQLEELDEVTARRRALCAAYAERLAGLFASERLVPMSVPAHAFANGHAWHVRCRSLDERRRVQRITAEKGVICLPHYVPLHLGSMGRALGYRPGDFPHSERAWETVLRLPLFSAMRMDQVDAVCDAVRGALA